jgi:hypothetical protein
MPSIKSCSGLSLLKEHLLNERKISTHSGLPKKTLILCPVSSEIQYVILHFQQEDCFPLIDLHGM